MRTFATLAPLVGVLTLGACSAPAPTAPPATPTSVSPKLTQGVDKAGEFLLTPYHRLTNELLCVGAKHWPEAAFDQQTISPETVESGQQFTHTLVYTVCGKDLEQFVGGTLYRKIYLGNRLIHSEPKPLDLKPGRWQLKALIEVPQGSRAGVYELRTEFVARGVAKRRIQLRASSKFEVTTKQE